jgi:hypothetical protein
MVEELPWEQNILAATWIYPAEISLMYSSNHGEKVECIDCKNVQLD